MKRGHEDVGHAAGGDGPTMDPLLVVPHKCGFYSMKMGVEATWRLIVDLYQSW